jgi:hypothetical protein
VLAPLGCQQTGTWSGIPTPFPNDSLALAGPPMGTIGGAFKTTFIHVDQLVSPLSPMEGSDLLKIRGPLAGIAFSVPQSFLYT